MVGGGGEGPKVGEGRAKGRGAGGRWRRLQRGAGGGVEGGDGARTRAEGAPPSPSTDLLVADLLRFFTSFSDPSMPHAMSRDVPIGFFAHLSSRLSAHTCADEADRPWPSNTPNE